MIVRQGPARDQGPRKQVSKRKQTPKTQEQQAKNYTKATGGGESGTSCHTCCYQFSVANSSFPFYTGKVLEDKYCVP